MTKFFCFLSILLLVFTASAAVQQAFEEDIISTSHGELRMTFIGHGTLLFAFGGKVIHVDPVRRYADYASLPKADIILVTHEHGDHLDPGAIEVIKKEGTDVILTEKCKEKYPGDQTMKNGEVRTVQGIKVEAVPAYNIVHMRNEGLPYHPKGEGNGYILNFADKRVYVAGDTENIPEMKALKNIDIAFLPMNLPYTMTPEMVADAAQAFRPKILYPYHYGNTEASKIMELLKDVKAIEVRIRKLN